MESRLHCKIGLTPIPLYSSDNKAQQLCESLKIDIELLSEAKIFEDKKSAGKRIYYLINDFMPVVKGLSDDKKENVKIGHI